MDPDVLNFAGVMVVCLGSAWAATFMVIRARREILRQKHPEPLPQQNYEDKLAQLQQSVDAIAVEVERIAEGQRFSTKLLAEGSRNGAYLEGR